MIGRVLPRRVLLICALLSTGAAAQPAAPLLQLDHGTVELGFVRAGQGSARATATLRGPTLRVSTQRQSEKDRPKRAGARFPLDVDKLVVHQGAIVFVRGNSELLRIHGLELTVDNYSSHPSATQTQITANGSIGSVGKIALTVSADAGKRSPDMTGHAEITGLKLDELGALVDKRVALTPITGSFSVNLDFSVRGGRINGTATPTLSNVGLDTGGAGGALDELKGRIPQLGGVEIFTRKLPTGKMAPLTATIPIRGSLPSADAPLWTAVLDVLRASLIDASSAGFLQLRSGAGS